MSNQPSKLSQILNGSGGVPRWIIIFAYIMAISTAGVTYSFFVEADPSTPINHSWMLAGRALAITLVLLIGAIMKDPKLLFAGFLIRLIADTTDVVGRFIASNGDLIAIAPYILLLLIVYIATPILWRKIQTT